MQQYEIFWGAAVALFAILEAVTSGLVSIWFAAGALVALLAAFLGANVWVQTIAFLVVSAASFILLRSRAVKNIAENSEKTDIDRIIGSEIIITETVNNKTKSGKASINDVEWKVKSSTGDIINEGEAAVVEKIEGVRLIVKK